MEIYIVHTDAWDGNRPFKEMTNDEIKKMYEEDPQLFDHFNSVEELAEAWNYDEIFYPNRSYMRVINN